jgi:predicted thioredoxin/glutaredoxin
MLQSLTTHTQSAISVEVFLERGCRSSATVIEAVNSAADQRRLDIRVYFRDRDAGEFLRRGIMICPAIYIGDSLAFYGPIEAQDILGFIHRNTQSLLTKGEIQ